MEQGAGCPTISLLLCPAGARPRSACGRAGLWPSHLVPHCGSAPLRQAWSAGGSSLSTCLKELSPRPPCPWEDSPHRPKEGMPFVTTPRAGASTAVPSAPQCPRPEVLPPVSPRRRALSPHSAASQAPSTARSPWRRGGSPSPPAQATAAGTDPSLPSCSSPPYLLSSRHPPHAARRRHGNARHRHGGAPRAPDMAAELTALPGDSLPGESLPCERLPGLTLPGDSLARERLPQHSLRGKQPSLPSSRSPAAAALMAGGA